MKKVLLSLFALATLGLALTSCGGNDEPDQKKTESFKGKASSFDNAVSASDLRDPDTGKTSKSGVVSIETTEDTKVIIGITSGSPISEKMPKGARIKSLADDIEYFLLQFTMEGTTFNLGSFGKLTVSREGAKLRLALTLADGTVYNFEGTPTEQLPASDRTTSLVRNWTVKETQVRVTDGATFARNFTGCDLNEIEKYAIDNGVAITESLEAGMKVQALGFTRAGTYYIVFENGKFDSATWRWTNESEGQLRYTWRNQENMGNQLEAGVAEARFYNGNLQLTLDSTINGNGKTYKTRLIVTLTD